MSVSIIDNLFETVKSFFPSLFAAKPKEELVAPIVNEATTIIYPASPPHIDKLILDEMLCDAVKRDDAPKRKTLIDKTKEECITKLAENADHNTKLRITTKLPTLDETIVRIEKIIDDNIETVVISKIKDNKVDTYEYNKQDYNPRHHYRGNAGITTNVLGNYVVTNTAFINAKHRANLKELTKQVQPEFKNAGGMHLRANSWCRVIPN